MSEDSKTPKQDPTPPPQKVVIQPQSEPVKRSDTEPKKK